MHDPIPGNPGPWYYRLTVTRQGRGWAYRVDASRSIQLITRSGTQDVHVGSGWTRTRGGARRKGGMLAMLFESQGPRSSFDKALELAFVDMGKR